MRQRASILSTALAIAAVAALGGAIAFGSTHLTKPRSDRAIQWAESPHNFYPGARTQTTRATCVNCHSTDGFIVANLGGGTLSAERLAKPPEYGVGCPACHNVDSPENMLALRVTGDVALPHGVKVSGGVSAACMTCHNARRGVPEEYVKTSARGTHEGPQTEMLNGTGAITYGKQIGSSVHTLVTFEGCVTCHKDLGPDKGEYGENRIAGHSFRMKWNGDTPEDPRDDIEHLKACQRCHPGISTFNIPAKGDYDGNGKVEGVQTEVGGLLNILAKLLPNDGAEPAHPAIPSDLTKTTVEQRMANYNWTLVNYDGSKGVHNTAYAVNVLRTTIQQLTGKKPAGADAVGAAFVANRPNDSTRIAEYSEAWKDSPHDFDPSSGAFGTAPTTPACVQCHSGTWFAKIQGRGEPPPQDPLPQPDKLGITCAACHESENGTDILALRKEGDVTLANGTVVQAGRAGLCMSCHNGRRPDPSQYIKTSFRGTHGAPQAEMFAATGVVTYGKTFRSTSHLTAVPDTCITCHLSPTLPANQRGYRKVGGHTLHMRWDGGTPANANDDIQHIGVCQKCHSDVTAATGFDRKAREDFDADGTVEGIQSEIKGLLALVAKELPKDANGNVAIPSDLSLTTEAQRAANFNYTVVVNDGSYGVHNPLFAADLLRTTYTELTGKALVPKGKSVAWDVNGDGVINVVDLVLVAQHFGETVAPAVAGIYPNGVSPDVDQNGKVDVEDIMRVSNAIEAGSGVAGAAVGATAWLDLQRLPMSADGGLVRVAVRVSAADRLAGYTLSLNYDPSVLTLEAMGNGQYLARDTNAVYWGSPVVDESAGKLERMTAVALGSTVPAGSGDEIAYVTFRVRELGAPVEKSIALRSIEAANPKARSLGVTIGATRFNPASVAWRPVLLQNYPNPFNPETWIPFDLIERSNVSIQILSMTGEVVRRIDMGQLDSGAYRTRDRAAYWDGRNDLGERVASGTYFYRIQAGTFGATRKLVILK
ncbi:hypothetical protein FJZ36_07430 [Candidatus Poribacteria bacterium]|nr:hypothetical protein [Candidatus Poribacteria bacterium]